ncbi:hypothetical protein ACLESD_39620, partial [Pyxidicoccus sp. 3LFB2]
MICPACAWVRNRERGDACIQCGTVLVPPTKPHIEDLVRTTLRQRVSRWHGDGLLDAGTAVRLEASLDEAPAASLEAPPAVSPTLPEPSAVRVEAWADDVADSLRRAADWRPGWGTALAKSLDEA